MTTAGRDARARSVRPAVHPPALRAILEGAIDYAGLFPPAALSMREAIRDYGEHQVGENAWALGRFVVSATRLEEFASAHQAWAAAASPNENRWRVSLVLVDAGRDVAMADALRRRDGHRWHIESVEAKAASAAQVRVLAQVLPETLERYIELPIDDELPECLGAIRAIGAAAKVRTGGTTADAFPSARELLRFMRACHAASVPFKATAGLHHPILGDYPLTYESDSASTTMFGYLNLFFAAAFLLSGASDDVLLGILRERDGTALRVGEDGLRWRVQQVPLKVALRARREVIRSVGSCSFREPIDGLAELAL